MADSLFKKKKKDSPKEFSWVGDPADALRGKPGQRISDRDYQAMLQYNRDLISPLDRGGGQNLRVGGRPARLAGAPGTATSYPQGFQTASPAALARITSKYGTGSLNMVTYPVNPNLTTSVAAPDGKFASPAPAVASPNPSLATPDDEPLTVPNPNLPAAGGAPADTNTGQTGYGATAEEMGGTPPDFVRNPLTGAPAQNAQSVALADWIAKGGSAATFHRAQVAHGIRSPIDARSGPDPLRSTASEEIAAARGWGMDVDKDARALGNQMTGEFNRNNATSQAEWSKRFTDAHADLMKTLDNN